MRIDLCYTVVQWMSFVLLRCGAIFAASFKQI